MRRIRKLLSRDWIVVMSAIVLTVCAFWVVTKLVSARWRAYYHGADTPPDRVELWSMLESVAAAATFATVVGGGIVVLWQQKQANDSRNLAAYQDIFEILMADENIEARRWIYTQLPDDPARGVALLQNDPEGHAKVKRVLNSLDYLGFLISQDWITSGGITEWMNPVIVKAWSKLKPYVEYETARRPNEPDYYKHVKELGEWCTAWRKKHVPGWEEPDWIDGAM